MNESDRNEIIARYAKHSTVEGNFYFDDDDKVWKPIPEIKQEAERQNRRAAEIDEYRTEGHQHTRRPLSSPHEPI